MKRGKNGKSKKYQKTVEAEIVKVTGTFGFARVQDAESDLFIPGRKLMNALPGDGVLLAVKPRRSELKSAELAEAEVVKITREADVAFTGRLEQYPDGGYAVLPDSYVRFPIALAVKSKRELGGAEPGDKILARVRERGVRGGYTAELTGHFGSADKAAACCRAILAGAGISTEFPPDALEQAAALKSGSIHPREIEKRLDLRGETIFTIDGADTKDIDDAVSLAATETGWELGVHIADVSHYVAYKSPLDAEALSRGTSVYYADAVVPMLPKELSNGICSLNPGEDRLALSAFIRLDKNAKTTGYRFAKTVIRSRLKGVYSEVNALLAGAAAPGITEKYARVSAVLPEMARLAEKLSANRQNRGGVDFESAESKIILDENGAAADIQPRERGPAERMIEEFMLTANEAAAKLAVKEKLPFVFRVHDKPAPDKLARLTDILETLKVNVRRPKTGAGTDSAETVKAILKAVSGSPLEGVVNTMVLRTMAKAVYSGQNSGHYGLALDDYTHFTSPIRRYPDLAVHRIISAFLAGAARERLDRRYGVFAREAAAHGTAREQAAMNAERGCVDAYKAEYMQRHMGEEFDAVISSVTGFGCYARLPNTVEGLIRAQSLGPGWQFDGGITLKDTLGAGSIRLGDKVRVVAVKAEVNLGQVTFELVNTHTRRG